MQNLKTLDELSAINCPVDRKLDILLLANLDYSAGCCADYINAIKDLSEHRVTVLNPMVKSRLDKLLMRPYLSLKNNGKKFDVIIIHYSICIISRNHISLILRKQIQNFKGVKIVIIQDEYRWINKIMKEMIFLRIDGIISLLNKQNLNKVYRHSKLKNILKVNALAGYVSQHWIGRKVPNSAERKKHIIYRGNSLPFWLGNAAYEKSILSKKVLENFEGKGLIVDVSSKPEDRIYGDGWMNFMLSGKCVIGLEGGASIFDFDGSIENAVRHKLKLKPQARYESIHDEILSHHEDQIYYRMITPRSFEAICMKTVQVMYPGEFSGILEPWRHYIPLERDFSNLKDVIDAIKDNYLLQEIADRAYDDIIKPMKYSDSSLASGVDGCVNFLFSQISGRN